MEVGAREVLGDLLFGSPQQLLVGHVIELPGQLESLAHPTGTLEHIVVTKGDQDRLDVELDVFSHVDHFDLPFCSFRSPALPVFPYGQAARDACPFDLIIGKIKILEKQWFVLLTSLSC